MQQGPANNESVTARMAYSEVPEGDAVIRIFPPSSGRPMEAPRRVRHPVQVESVRPLADSLDLDSAGFALKHQPTTFTDWFDEESVRRDYYPEVAARLAETLGAAAVFVFDHNVRSHARADSGQAGVRRPVDGAHNDYTLASGPRRIREVLEDNDTLDLIGHRAAIVNVWRPIRGPVEDHPLAICDARSTTTGDFMATRIEHYQEDALAAPSLAGEVYSFLYNPAHRWFFAPHMQPTEVWLLKCFDTATDGRARFTGHTGFQNPAAAANPAPRESIEARTVVVYPQ